MHDILLDISIVSFEIWKQNKQSCVEMNIILIMNPSIVFQLYIKPFKCFVIFWNLWNFLIYLNIRMFSHLWFTSPNYDYVVFIRCISMTYIRFLDSHFMSVYLCVFVMNNNNEYRGQDKDTESVNINTIQNKL